MRFALMLVALMFAVSGCASGGHGSKSSRNKPASGNVTISPTVNVDGEESNKR